MAQICVGPTGTGAGESGRSSALALLTPAVWKSEVLEHGSIECVSLCWGVVVVWVTIGYSSQFLCFSQTGGTCPKLCAWATFKGLDIKFFFQPGASFQKNCGSENSLEHGTF